jgi:hypothetical protein
LKRRIGRKSREEEEEKDDSSLSKMKNKIEKPHI